MKNENTPVTIRRMDYRPPGYTIGDIRLRFELDMGWARVTSVMKIRRSADDNGPLELDGVDLELESVHVDGQLLSASQYVQDEESLVISALPAECELQIITKINAAENTTLSGLYQSAGIYCTQCEAEGFRRITYFLDRPDVLSTYSVRIEADRSECPVLLANGNRVDTGNLPDGRHFVEWHDPFPKPCYLFALVAGNLSCLSDSYRTITGRDVALEIHVESHNLHKCEFAMRALKASMAWDEQRYGLAYDLDIYMIVAVDDFNMGAMENKGLNIFNSKYVLADQTSATDADFLGVESVIAHEYFHNWTGNRVTCRDWFQLSLKEGLTVFRDQQFSADQHSAAVKRIEDVRLLRQHQFAEDAGPMAHPIRPDEYIEINNFYTVTVYEKGAEVIRMIHTLLGEAGFRRGMDLYFRRFDGQAVTCDDFVQAMEDGGDADLAQFRRWYGQAGTPLLQVRQIYDATAGTLQLDFDQSCPPTPGQPEKHPMHLPVRLALLNTQGEHLALHCQTAGLNGETEAVVDITRAEQQLVFTGLAEKPVPSLLRDFSAPVMLGTDLTIEDDIFLLGHDTDLFNRWDAGQRLYRRVIRGLADNTLKGVDDPELVSFYQAWQRLLTQADSEPAFVAEAMHLPGIEMVAERDPVIRIEALDSAIQALKAELASRHIDTLTGWLDEPGMAGFTIDSAAIGRRSLVNTSLQLIGHLSPEVWLPRLLERYRGASNMTDRITCLNVICHSSVPERDELLQDFYHDWTDDRLVIDKWFRAQATARRADSVVQVQQLMAHPAFDQNPNRVRSLIGAFASGNLTGFHQSDGAGYRLLAEFVADIDRRNPQVAAALVGPLCRWQRFDSDRQALMKESLAKIAAMQPLSTDVYEKVHRALQVKSDT